MALLDDLAAEFEAYPHNYLDVRIVQVDPPGSIINEDEEVAFRIEVSNSGPLDVNDLSLLVEGMNGTEVQSNGSNTAWLPSFTISGEFFGDVLGHSADEGPVVSPGSTFHFRQSRDFSTPTDLVRVSVAGWRTTFDHFSAGHTPADPLAKDVYRAEVAE